MGDMIKFSIHNFWPDFNYTENFFVSLLKDIYGEDFALASGVHDSNLCLVGENNVPRDLDRRKTKIITFMAEPKPVQYKDGDYHLSFDPSRYDLKNVRLPLWYIYINFHNLQNQKNPIPAVTVDEINYNKWSETKRDKFCVAPFSAVHKNRVDFFNLLNTYKQTHGFGLPFGNGDNDRNQLRKYNAICTFRFAMAFENTMKLGYVTEKLFQAKTAGCIPIYWGDSYCLSDFNPEAFIYVNNFSSPQECLEYVKYIDSNEHLYQKMKNAPLFKYDIVESLNSIKKQLKETITL
jgi:hypothetical protein